jgi:hypothetical protein
MGKANNNPTKLLAYDTFLQSEGALSGKALPLGGNWSGAGDSGDFTVIAAEDLARRTETSDADLNTGRYAVAGSEEPTSSKVSVKVHWASAADSAAGIYRAGAFLRYSVEGGEPKNWLMAYFTNHVFSPPKTSSVVLCVAKRVAGTVTVLGEVTVIPKQGGPELDHTIALSASADGTWQAWAYAAGATAQPTPLLTGQDSALATGGTLAKGKGGFYDAYTSATARTRTYDNFTLLAAEPAEVVLYAGKTAEIRSEGYFRQDESGDYYGELPQRGADIYLEPEGDSGAINRIVIAARRNDIEVEADDHVTDKISVEVRVKERFLAPRG